MSYPPQQAKRMSAWAKWLIAVAITVTSVLLVLGIVWASWISYWVNAFFTSGETGPEVVTGDVAADFNEDTCAGFDLAPFEEFTGEQAELTGATAAPGDDTKALYCDFATETGHELSIGITAGTDTAYAEDALVPRREQYAEDAAWSTEDITLGSMVGFSCVRPGEAWETYGVEVGFDRVMITVSLVYEPGAGGQEALGVADTTASQVLQRFMAYV